MATEYKIKYGIYNDNTSEYVSWFNKTKNKYVLFDTDENLVYDSMTELDPSIDVNVETVTLPEDFDGSGLVNNEQAFVQKKLVFKAL